MKKLILTFLLLLGITYASADVIILKDGNTMKVYNVEPASKWVYYTETQGEDAPVKKVAIDKVFGYKIGDGPMTSVGAESPNAQPQQQTSSAPATPRKLDPVPAADNDALIAAYNNHPPLTHNGKKPQPDSNTKYFISLWGIEEGSVLSDENVEIGFEKIYHDDKKHTVEGTLISVSNKTDSPLYIDLASSYKILNGGFSVPYFTNSVYSENSNKTSSTTLNFIDLPSSLDNVVKGTSVGNVERKGTEIQTAEQRVLTIPPHSRVTLPAGKYSTGQKIVDCYEPFLFYNPKLTEVDYYAINLIGTPDLATIALDKKTQMANDNEKITETTLNIGKWSQTDFTPETTPKKIGRIITYSKSPDFSTSTSLPVNLYMRGAFGVTPTLADHDIQRVIKHRFDDKNYSGITDKEHFIVGVGLVKKK